MKYVIIKNNKYLRLINGIYPQWVENRAEAHLFSINEVKELTQIITNTTYEECNLHDKKNNNRTEKNHELQAL